MSATLKANEKHDLLTLHRFNWMGQEKTESSLQVMNLMRADSEAAAANAMKYKSLDARRRAAMNIRKHMNQIRHELDMDALGYGRDVTQEQIAAATCTTALIRGQRFRTGEKLISYVDGTTFETVAELRRYNRHARSILDDIIDQNEDQNIRVPDADEFDAAGVDAIQAELTNMKERQHSIRQTRRQSRAAAHDDEEPLDHDAPTPEPEEENENKPVQEESTEPAKDPEDTPAASEEPKTEEADSKPEEQPKEEEQPAEEQPAEEQPAEEQPAEEQPAEEQPVEEEPVEENKQTASPRAESSVKFETPHDERVRELEAELVKRRDAYNERATTVGRYLMSFPCVRQATFSEGYDAHAQDEVL